jgi:S-DNA-T family DNA segregation ATPase FtsK/SpoIIIE
MGRASSRRTPSRRPTSRQPRWQITPAQRSWIAGLALIGIALLTLLSFVPQNRGTVTTGWIDLLRYVFGWGMYLVPVALALFGLWALTSTSNTPLLLPWPRLAGAGILYIATLSLLHHLTRDPTQTLQPGPIGGYVGFWLSRGLEGAMGWAGAAVVLVILEGMGLMLTFDLSLAEVVADAANALQRLWRYLGAAQHSLRMRHAAARRRSATPPATVPPFLPDYELPPTPMARPAPGGGSSARSPAPAMPILEPHQGAAAEAGVPPEGSFGAPDGSLGRRWLLPVPAAMLMESEDAQMSLSDIREKTHLIEETLTSLGVPVTVVEVNPGPVVTQFGLEPGYVERRDRQGRVKRGKVKVSRIAALANDLALALAAAPIRIEAPVPGKGIVGIEVPNRESSIVGLRSVMESEQFLALGPAALAVGFGRDVSGTPVVGDLATLPHLLIAGATGTGKSVCLNSLIACLLCRNTPDDLRLLMIDPKRVELSGYNGIPHLIAPVVVEPDRVVGALAWVTREMDRRYKVFARVGARNMEGYNRLAISQGEARLPYIVVFIDELAHLMMVAADDVERLVCRIAQLSRATGIHLVIATQRPSVDVVTGLIKANFPARVAFLVSSQVDSRVILDAPGAEKLLGRGDALYMAPDSPKLMRIQGCFVSDDEINRLVSSWRGQAMPSARPPAADGEDAERSGPPLQPMLWPDVKAEQMQEDQDPLLPQAIALVRDEGRASVSFLQRRLRIGYTRAARLIDLLEERGIIGEATGSSRPRDVIASAEDQPAPDEPVSH